MSITTACIMHPPVISSSVTRGSTLFPQRLKTKFASNDLHHACGSRSNDILVRLFSKKHPREFLSTQLPPRADTFSSGDVWGKGLPKSRMARTCSHYKPSTSHIAWLLFDWWVEMFWKYVDNSDPKNHSCLVLPTSEKLNPGAFPHTKTLEMASSNALTMAFLSAGGVAILGAEVWRFCPTGSRGAWCNHQWVRISWRSSPNRSLAPTARPSWAPTVPDSVNTAAHRFKRFK